ncbi:hypothetical protein ACTQ54_01870 [Fundicoccus sp. Sow4_H7]|uniref:hypothetical protein n=1 Tax=Fundicoccus sp. Sow4_H7 TaxID=3438784 RepID=UPI003F8EA8D4
MGCALHRRSSVSSVHTTLLILESLADYEKNGYHYRLKDIQKAVKLGQEYLLQRYLFKSLRTGEVIREDFKRFQYPSRWKYDCIRALEYFAVDGFACESLMEPALTLVRKRIKKVISAKGLAKLAKRS